MQHRKYSVYTFIVGSDYHDYYVRVEAYTKAEATKMAMKRKVYPSDHCRFIDSHVIMEYKKVNGKYQWVENGKG